MKKSKIAASKWSLFFQDFSAYVGHYDTCIYTSAEANAFIREKWASNIPHHLVQYHAIFLDDRSNVIGHCLVCYGHESDHLLDMQRLIVMTCYAHAVSIIICHNHRDGSIQPDSDDLDLNFKLQVALGYIDCTIWDQIIVGKDGYYSFDDKGLILS